LEAISYYFIAEATGAILAIADGRLDKFVNSFVLVIVLLVQISCIGFLVWYMYVNHEYLSIARNTRRRLERYFGLHDLKVVDEAIVPEAWRPHAIYKYFEVHSILLPLGIFVVSIQLASIYVALKMLFGEVGLPR